jgi:hypothetical protein
MKLHCLDKPTEISYLLVEMLFEKANQAFLPQHSIPFPICFGAFNFELTYGGETASTGTKKLRLHTEHPASS